MYLRRLGPFSHPPGSGMLVGCTVRNAFLLVSLAAPAACGADLGAPAGHPLPAWLKLGAELRGRLEVNTATGFLRGNDDGYYLHRLRLNAALEPHSQIRFFIQVQDSHAPGLGQTPAPASVVNTLDLRQGYLETGAAGTGWSLRVGRQDILLGEERLVGAAGWGNVTRSFDAARLSYKRKGARLDWFASAVVVPLNGSFDHPRLANGFYGFYSSFDNLVKNSTVEPYVLWKTASAGDLDVYTVGARAVGKLPRGFDHGLEMAFQVGHAAREDIRAWAGHWVLGYTLPVRKPPPRLLFEYNYASGDRDPTDGRRGTFDQLYPTNHYKYGTADRIGWRNIRDLMPGLEWRPTAKWRFNLDWHRFWLASLRDALYTEAGAALLRAAAASHRRVGDELDFQLSWQLGNRLTLGAGVAHIFPGPYLKQAGRGAAVSYPYLMWSYRL